MTKKSRRVQWCAHLMFGINIGTFGNEQFNHRGMAGTGGKVERRERIIVARIDIGALADEALYLVNVPILCSIV